MVLLLSTKSRLHLSKRCAPAQLDTCGLGADRNSVVQLIGWDDHKLPSINWEMCILTDSVIRSEMSMGYIGWNKEIIMKLQLG